MAFEQQEEEYEFSNVFQDDEGEEVYEERPEFRTYSDEEIDSKWGNFSFEDLVFELENIIGRAKRYFFSKRKRVIDAEEVINLTRIIEIKLPDEIVKANDILDEEEQIISDAKRNATATKNEADAYHAKTIHDADIQAANAIETANNTAKGIVDDAEARAEQIIAQAEAKARHLVSESNITKMARDQAAQIVSNAHTEAAGIIADTNQNGEEYIARVVAWAEENINGVNEYIATVLSNTRELNVNSINQIDGASARYNSSLKEQMASLKRHPEVARRKPVQQHRPTGEDQG